MADLKADLNDNKKQIYIVQLKKRKTLKDFQQDGTFFLIIEDGTEFPKEDRRITIFSDNKPYQYYYPRDGKLFNDTFELIYKHESSKPKSSPKLVSKSSSASKSRSPSSSASSRSASSSASSSSASRSLPSLRSVSDSVYLTEPVRNDKSASASPTVWNPINKIDDTMLTREIKTKPKNLLSRIFAKFKKKKTTLAPLRSTKIFGGKKSKKSTRKKRA
jgi:hypothetical protein